MENFIVRSYKMKLFGEKKGYLSIDGEAVAVTGDSILVKYDF